MSNNRTKMEKFIAIVFIISIFVSVGFFGLVVWAIIKLVNHLVVK